MYGVRNGVPMNASRWQRLSLTLALPLLFLSPTGSTGSDDQPAPGLKRKSHDPKVWPIQFMDDMHEDRRPQYGKSGEILWRPGKIAVRPGSVLWPNVKPGARLELTVDLDIPPLTIDGTWRTEFHIPTKKEEALVARLENRRTKDGMDGTIVILHESHGEGKPGHETLRTFIVKDGLKSGPWTFSYRYGLLQIELGSKIVGVGYLPHHRSVAGIMCFSRQGEVGIRRLTFVAESRPDRQYTAAENAEFDEAVKALDDSQKGFEIDNNPRAYASAEKARRIFQPLLGERHPYTLKAMGMQGLAACQPGGRYVEGRLLLDRALQLATEVYGETHPETAQMWTRLAGARLVIGDSMGALRNYERAVEIFRTSEGDKSLDLGVTLVQAGYAARSVNQGQHARILLEQAVRSLEGALGTEAAAVADAHRELGSLLTEQEQFEAGRQHIETALKIFRSTAPLDIGHFETHLRLAELFLAEGKSASAQATYQEALPLAEKMFGEKSDPTAYVLGMLGTIAFEQGRPKESEDFLAKALKLIRQIHGDNDPISAKTINWLAASYHVQGKFAAAASLLRQALDIEVKAAKQILPALAEAEAIEFIQDTYLSRDLLVSNYRRLSGSPAEKIYREIWQARALVGLLMEDRRRHRFEEGPAQADLRSFREVRREIAAMIQAGKPDSDTGSTRLKALTDRREELELRLATRIPALSYQRLTTQAELADVLRKLPPDCAVVDFLRSNLPETNGRNYDAFILRRTKEKPNGIVDWVQLGAAEPIDRAIVSWLGQVRPGKSAQGNPPATPAGDSPRADLLVRKLIWNVLEPYLADVQHVMIIPDAALTRVPWSALPGRKPGSFLLEDYALSTLNCAQQLAELPAEPAPIKDGDRLLLAGGLEYGELGGEPVPKLGPRPAWQGPWPYLPGTLDEVNQISSYWPRTDTVTRLTGSAVCKSELQRQLPQARFVHLATHGYFEERYLPASVASRRPFSGAAWNPGAHHSVPIRGNIRNPLVLSGLVLSGANRSPDIGTEITTTNEGLISGEESAELVLPRADLVVLSACETGLGEVVGGEGVFGLQRAFHLAGAKSVAASLWQIPDQATQMLMERFYKNLWQKKMTKLEALREAQLWMLKEAPKQPELLRGITRGNLKFLEEDIRKEGRLPPYYWAAFLLSGDWR